MLMTYAVTLSFFFFAAKILQQRPVNKWTLPAPCSSLQCPLCAVRSLWCLNPWHLHESIIHTWHYSDTTTNCWHNSVEKLAPWGISARDWRADLAPCQKSQVHWTPSSALEASACVWGGIFYTNYLPITFVSGRGVKSLWVLNTKIKFLPPVNCLHCFNV